MRRFLTAAFGSAAVAGYKPVLQGYDMVAYMDEGRAVRGDSIHKYTHTTYDYSSNPSGDVIGDYHFHFASEENSAKFKAYPWKYAPKYGGF